MLTDQDPMPFGAHKGKLMQDVPASYLDWLRGQEWLEGKYPDVYQYIQENGKYIDQDLDLGD